MPLSKADKTAIRDAQLKAQKASASAEDCPYDKDDKRRQRWLTALNRERKIIGRVHRS